MHITKEMLTEVVSALVFAAITLLLVNPLDFWMPNMMHMTLLALGVAVFGVFVLLVLRESVADERDDIHRMRAGRIAFLTGGSILLLAVVVQSLAHAVDPWVAGALLSMVLAKVGTRIWSAIYG